MAKGQDDLNRFLAEIDRLRKKSADGGGSPPPPKAKAVPVARPVSPPPPPPPPVRSKKRIAEDPPVVPMAMSVPPPPSVPAFAAPDSSLMPASTVATIRTIDAARAVVPAGATTSLVAPAGGQVQRRHRSLGPTSVANLLRDRQSLANALALQIVLGPPKCREQS